MTGKQPDQQICEIFFLCLDLIKKNLSCVAFLHSSVRKCSRKLWKIEVRCTWKCLQPGWKSGTPRSTGGSCHFLIFPSSACHSSPPSHCGEEANAGMIIICFSSSALFGMRQGAEASVPTLNESCAPSCCRTAPFPYHCWWGLLSTPPKSLCSTQVSKESELHDMLCVCDEDGPCSCCSPCSTVLEMPSASLSLCCLQTRLVLPPATQKMILVKRGSFSTYENVPAPSKHWSFLKPHVSGNKQSWRDAGSISRCWCYPVSQGWAGHSAGPHISQLKETSSGVVHLSQNTSTLCTGIYLFVYGKSIRNQL